MKYTVDDVVILPNAYLRISLLGLGPRWFWLCVVALFFLLSIFVISRCWVKLKFSFWRKNNSPADIVLWHSFSFSFYLLFVRLRIGWKQILMVYPRSWGREMFSYSFNIKYVWGCVTHDKNIPITKNEFIRINDWVQCLIDNMESMSA